MKEKLNILIIKEIGLSSTVLKMHLFEKLNCSLCFVKDQNKIMNKIGQAKESFDIVIYDIDNISDEIILRTIDSIRNSYKNIPIIAITKTKIYKLIRFLDDHLINFIVNKSSDIEILVRIIRELLDKQLEPSIDK